ncbi:MAG: hypothetical protein U5L45_24310 [Saprospiraceae bacterium]|nr:hypothetical protein [Saprospiraceae bacterium]
MVHFSGKARKMNHIPLLRERSEREKQQFRFYLWFQNFVNNLSFVVVLQNAPPSAAREISRKKFEPFL